MFELLYQILHQNWRYFFKTSVLTSVQKGEDTMENEALFTAAMQVCAFSGYSTPFGSTVMPLFFLNCADVTFPGFRTVFPAAWHPHFQTESFLFGVTEQQAQVVPQSKLSFCVFSLFWAAVCLRVGIVIVLKSELYSNSSVSVCGPKWELFSQSQTTSSLASLGHKLKRPLNVMTQAIAASNLGCCEDSVYMRFYI